MRFLEAARQELDEAARWYEEQRTGLGLRFYDAAEAAADQIATHPRIGARWSDDVTEVRR